MMKRTYIADGVVGGKCFDFFISANIHSSANPDGTTLFRESLHTGMLTVGLILSNDRAS
jgi:hypothetical protein